MGPKLRTCGRGVVHRSYSCMGSTVTYTHIESIRHGFADDFTVYAIDRRGHGESGDGDEYTLEREAEDVAAVLRSIGEPAMLLGSSVGALIRWRRRC